MTPWSLAPRAGSWRRSAGCSASASAAGRIEDRGVIEAGGAGRGRRAAVAFPGVEAEMMVIAAGRDEGGAGPAGGQLEAQHAAIESRARARDRPP